MNNGDRRNNERGAALITVLVFMVLLLILITGMLGVTGNEVLIAGLQRDSVEAFDRAQAGIEEGVRRIEGGRVWQSPFQGSLAAGVSVQVLYRQSGPSAAFLEIQSDATVRRARRRLSLLAQAVPRMTPPNIVYGQNCTSQGNAAEVARGDIYCETYVTYFDWPPDTNTLTYTGWRVSRRCNDPDSGCPANETQTGPCYSHKDCVDDANLDQQPDSADRCNEGTPSTQDGRCRAYPGTRRSVYLNSVRGATLENIRATAAAPACTISGNSTYNGVRADSATQIASNFDRYGFDTDAAYVDVNGNIVPIATPQAKIPTAWDPDGPDGPLPSWSFPCGIPYEMVAEPVYKEDGSLIGDRYFKFVVFEHWYHIYWKLEGLEFKKRDGDACTPGATSCLPTNVEPNLVQYPDFGTIPPFPDFATLKSSAPQIVTSTSGGDVINAGDPGINWGTCTPITNCGGSGDDVQIILLQCSPSTPCEFTVNNNDQNTHGLLLVDGNLKLNGNGIYYGTIIVNGNMTLGSGDFTVYGGVVAKSASYLTGKLTVYAGGTVGNPIIGPAVVTAKSWWER